MKTLIRTLVWFVGILVLLFVAVGVAVTFYFDPNDYKADIEAVIESNTGRDVSIEGDLSLSLLPCCAVEVGRIDLGNPPGFSQKRFLSIDSAAVSIGLLPLLLRQEIVIGEVVLEGLDATLITRSDGSVNWEFSGEADDAGRAVEAPVEPDAESSVTLNQLSVEGLRFTNGRVRWLDETSGDDILISDLNLATGAIVSGSPFDLEAGFTIRGLAEGIDGQFSYEGTPVLDEENLTADLSNSVITLILQGDDLPDGKVAIDISATQLMVGDAATPVVAKQLTVDVATGPLQLRAVASGEVNDAGPNFSGTLETDNFSPRALLALLDADIETADPKALSSMDIQSNWMLNGDRAGLSNMVVRLDDSNLSGDVGLGSIEKQQILFDLVIDAINLDRYLAPVVEDEAAPVASRGAASTAAEEELIPVEALRELNAQGRFRIGRMIISDATLSDLNVTLNAQGGRLRVSPLTAALYEGTYSGDVRLDVRGKQPLLSLNENLTNLQIGGLLLDMEDIQNIEGLFQASIKATSSGNSEAALIAGLNGDVSFNLADGLYRGRDFWYELRSQKARLSGDPVPPAPANPKTDISKLQGSGVVTNGVLQNNDFAMQLPFIRLNGAGQADLNTLLLNYKLNAKVIGSPQFDDGSNLDELKGLTLPVAITGPAEQPDITVDLTAVITGLATKKLQDRLLKKYGGDSVEPEGDGTEQQPKSDRDARKDALRKGLNDLLN